MPSARPIKIIILDDHPIIIDGIRLLLKDSDQYVLHATANNLPELFSILAEPADILILDLNINGKNILNDIPMIRARQPKIKIVIFSSYNTPSLVRRAFEYEVNAYLLKDTTQDGFFEALTCITSKQYFIGPNVKVPKKGF